MHGVDVGVVGVKRQRRSWHREDLRRVRIRVLRVSLETDLVDPRGRQTHRAKDRVTGSALPPLSDEAVDFLSMFSDHVGLDTTEFERCFEE